MKKIFFLSIMIFVTIIATISYAKYILTFQFSYNGLSNLFYFETEVKNTVELIDDEAEIHVVIKNNDGTNYNLFDTKYEIYVENNEKFTVDEQLIEGTIIGNTLKDEEISIKLKLKDGITTLKKIEEINLKISSILPYKKDFVLNIPITVNNLQVIPDFTFSNEVYPITMGKYNVYRTTSNLTLNGTVDISNMNYIEFDFYVPEGYDVSKIYLTDSQLEIGSAGIFDKSEINYYTGNYINENIIYGTWNHIRVPIANTDGSTGVCDLENVNFLGLYWNNEKAAPNNSYEIPNCQIKDFKFTKYIIEE